MSLVDSDAQYGSITKSLHWLTALLILTVIPLGIIANGQSEDLLAPGSVAGEAEISRTALLFSLHKTFGIAIFIVALVRIAWAITQHRPRPLATHNRVSVFLAKTIHWLLYGSLVLVPLSGWSLHSAAPGFAPILWPLGQSLPFIPASASAAEFFAGLHIVLERVLILALLLHVAAALKHHFIDRDQTLRRMLRRDNAHLALSANMSSALPFLAAVLVWLSALSLGAVLGAYGTLRSPMAPSLEQTQTEWQVTNGTLVISVAQLGNSVSGEFSDWTASITFDPSVNSGTAGRVEVVVATGSLTLGLVTDQAKGPDFLDTGSFPTATFTGEIERTETGYSATGPLTLRDISMPILLVFDLTTEEETAQMTGTVVLDRRDYGIGHSLPDEKSLGFTVNVEVSLTAQRVPPGT